MHNIKKYSLFFCLFLFSIKLFSGFAAGTIVKVPCGYKLIEELQPGDIVCSINKSGEHNFSKVKKTISYLLKQVVLISVGDDVIVVAPQQTFYDPVNKVWRSAKFLQKSMHLLSGYKNIVQIKNVEIIDCEIEFFDICLDDVHTFFVSQQEIVVHNFIPQIVVGISIAFEVGSITFESAYFGISVVGCWLGIKWFKPKDKKCSTKLFVGDSQVCAGSPDPDDDDYYDDDYYDDCDDDPLPENDTERINHIFAK